MKTIHGFAIIVESNISFKEGYKVLPLLMSRTNDKRLYSYTYENITWDMYNTRKTE